MKTNLITNKSAIAFAAIALGLAGCSAHEHKATDSKDKASATQTTAPVTPKVEAPVALTAVELLNSTVKGQVEHIILEEMGYDIRELNVNKERPALTVAGQEELAFETAAISQAILAVKKIPADKRADNGVAVAVERDLTQEELVNLFSSALNTANTQRDCEEHKIALDHVDHDCTAGFTYTHAEAMERALMSLGLKTRLAIVEEARVKANAIYAANIKARNEARAALEATLAAQQIAEKCKADSEKCLAASQAILEQVTKIKGEIVDLELKASHEAAHAARAADSAKKAAEKADRSATNADNSAKAAADTAAAAAKTAADAAETARLNAEALVGKINKIITDAEASVAKSGDEAVKKAFEPVQAELKTVLDQATVAVKKITRLAGEAKAAAKKAATSETNVRTHAEAADASAGAAKTSAEAAAASAGAAKTSADAAAKQAAVNPVLPAPGAPVVAPVVGPAPGGNAPVVGPAPANEPVVEPAPGGGNGGNEELPLVGPAPGTGNNG